MAAVALLAGGAGVAVAASGCGDDGTTPPSESKPAGKPETATAPTTGRPQATTSVPANALIKRRRRNRSERGIQKAVTQLVSGAERGDARAFCTVVGQSAPSGAGGDPLGACARAANVPLESLPTSDELSIDRVRLAGDRATVTLVAGVRVLLRRRGDAWTVTRVAPGA